MCCVKAADFPIDYMYIMYGLQSYVHSFCSRRKNSVSVYYRSLLCPFPIVFAEANDPEGALLRPLPPMSGSWMLPFVSLARSYSAQP